MKSNKGLYSILVLLLSICSVILMLSLKERNVILSGDNGTLLSEPQDEYIGYIFDDYNVKVNLGYSEIQTDIENETENTAASAYDMPYTVDGIRAERSERMIDERALMDEILNSEYELDK